MDINYYLPQYNLLVVELQKKFGTRLKKISEIADVICGPFGSAIKNTDYQESGIPLIRIANISKEGYMDYGDLVYISEKLGNSLARTQVAEGDIVISQRGSLGQCAVVDDTFRKMNISANIIAIKNIHDVSASFLHDYLQSVVGQTLLERNVSGQVQQKITTQDIADLPVPINCDEIKLVEIMRDAYVSRTCKFRKARELLNGMSDYIHSVLGMNEEIKDKPTIYAIKGSQASHKRIDPEYHNPFYTHRISEIQKLEHDMLGNIVEFSTESWKQKDLFDTVFPYIEISGVKLKENTYETIDVPVNEAPSRAKMIVRNGDIIVSTTRPHRGAIATIVCSDTQVQIASTGFCVLRDLKRDDVLKEYLQWILLDNYVLLQMLQRSSGGNYPAISGDELKNVVIPIPDIDIQRKICEEASKRKTHAYASQQEAKQEWEQAKVRFEKELLGE